jgi:hypothetical protein
MSTNGSASGYQFDRERTFYIDHQSDVDGKKYAGSFTAKRLSLFEQAKVGTLKAQLSGGMHCNVETGSGVDLGTDFLNDMVAHCEVSIVNAPEWWNPREAFDLDMLRKVYEEVVKFRTFREWTEGPTDGKRPSESGADKRPQAELDDLSPQVVDMEVQATPYQ